MLAPWDAYVHRIIYDIAIAERLNATVDDITALWLAYSETI